jgi:L-alanine-DL-glutamate epimerase-like enolase superfamily enzyme
MTPIEGLDVSVYRVPTDLPEADGTLAWDATTLVLAEPVAGGQVGVGFTYSSRASATVIVDHLREVVVGRDVEETGTCWEAMVRAIRNFGRPGVVSAAIAAVDLALWDLKAKVVGVSLAELLGPAREAAPIYGSGGFTTYTIEQLREQLGGWIDHGMSDVKMKIGGDWGRHPAVDLGRVAAARDAIGAEAGLFVDANGAYTRKQAIRLARHLRERGVTWFEEPVSSDDLSGLRVVRDRSDVDVAAGEYGYDLVYFERMCAAGAVDVLQADVTRCAGLTEWLRVAAVADAHGLELSGHCAPSMHLAPACAIRNLRHLEYFHDHVRLERALFDGVSTPENGSLRPDLTRPGNGLELKRSTAEQFLVDTTARSNAS